MPYHVARRQLSCEIITPAGPLPVRAVLGIGLNYAAHAREQGGKVPERPVVFTKSPFAVVPTDTHIVVPKVCQEPPQPQQVDFEGELVVVIGHGPNATLCRDVPRDRAHDFILGYAAGNDVSARWWQKLGSGGQFVRGKSFDTFAPLGDVVPADQVPTPGSLTLKTYVNNQLMQDSTTADLIFDIPTLITELSKGTTLLPGTLIYTGTPSGVGMARTPPVFLAHGDTIRVEIQGLPVLENTVHFE
jgi:2-keto-4-pentenoate hydratase/2-oxohepta-3-ene-1,7-dioic acid hydratase in catechol pathway